MLKHTTRTTNIALSVGLWLLAGTPYVQAERVMKTEHWGRSGPDFEACDQRIMAGAALNLLAREGAKVTAKDGVDARQVPFLTDGKAGKAGAEGRVYVDGHPAVITCYLGAPRLIHEVGMFTYNGDARANQDFEVRFANNEKNPGKPPGFRAEPDVSTGPHVLGQNGGGYHTSFLDNTGAPLVPGKVDWIEFRIWRTYNVRAGSPAKTKEPAGWTSVVELEVLGGEAELAGKDAAGKTGALTPGLRMRGTVQRPPRPPVYVKRATWQESMFASREAGIKRDAEESINGGGGSALPGDAPLWSLLQRDFDGVEAQRRMAWERADSIWAQDWSAGDYGTLANRYAQHTAGTKLQAKARELAARAVDAAGLEAVRRAYYDSKALTEAVAQVTAVDLEAMRRAIRDLTHTFPQRYKRGPEYLERLATLEKVIQAASGGTDIEAVGRAGQELLDLRVEALLTANPLIDFDKVLLIKRGANNLGLPANWVTNASIGKTGYDNEICILSPVTPNGELTTFHKPDKGAFVGDVDLHWDGDRMLFSSIGSNDRWQVFEMGIDPATGQGAGAPQQVTPGVETDVDNFDPCYLPDGRVIFSSTRAFHGVPCVGGSAPVANLVLLERETGVERQLCFDQDQNWCPTVLNNGRVLYTRWEYSDTPHYFTRLLFHMNPDGSGQMEYAFSNSYWPNSTFYARPVPNHPTKVVAVISGHHGVPRMGELIVYDSGKGRHEGQGTVQRIPGYGKPVEPRIADGLVNSSWPRFLHPYPLSDKYFLVSCQPNSQSTWGLYLVDVFDNMLKILDVPGYAIMEPVPLRRTKAPPVIPDRIDTSQTTAVLHLQDVYAGAGLKGVPRGTVKKLRIYEFHFGYNGMGGHINVGIDGPWDVRRIRGTVPVHEDGSALFRVPANTPLAVQPLDTEGRALQVMRSWYTAMPGEVATCVGCHEQQNSTPHLKPTIAASKPPSNIEPWRGPVRGFAFKREVQPVLDKYCVGCHDGTQREGEKPRPNFADTSSGWRGFTNSYIALHPYVRRPGPESDYHLQKPMEWHASTSELVQMLEKGHNGVKLDAEAWDRLVTWIDLNVPDHGTWAEHKGEINHIVQRRLAMRAKYANCVENPEEYAAPEPERVSFVRPSPAAERKPFAGKVPDWPFDAATAAKRQADVDALSRLKIDLGDGQKLELALIPAGLFVMGSPDGFPDEYPPCQVKINKPFYMGTCEITNAQYGRFDPSHDSGYISVMNKDHGSRGRPANGDNQPVIRVPWLRAVDFCRWLSDESGRTFSLPTEAQWEWACRAGTATPLSYGSPDTDFGKLANLADKDLTQLCIRDSPKWIPAVGSVSDGAVVTTDVGRYGKPNPWGLHDMHANVAEWTLTTYKPYPYAADGRNEASDEGSKVARGGSYYDRPHRARSAARHSYLPWQCVHNVGFRVVCPVEEGKTVAAAR